MATVTQIKSQTWGISLAGYGTIVEGLASVKQCLRIILTTRKRTDPLRPEFGSNIFNFIDSPLDIAIPNIKKEIIEAIGIWESRVKVTYISHAILSPGKPLFKIGFTLVDEDLTDEIILNTGTGQIEVTAETEIIVQAFFPDNPNQYLYSLDFAINNDEVRPSSNNLTFDDLSKLFSWIKENWHFVGRWYQLPDRFVLYLTGSNVQSANLSIGLIEEKWFTVIYPVLKSNQYYKISFIANGKAYTNDEARYTPEEVLQWLIVNYSNYAIWKNIQDKPLPASVFSEEFTSEFDTDSSVMTVKLQCRVINGNTVDSISILATPV